MPTTSTTSRNTAGIDYEKLFEYLFMVIFIIECISSVAVERQAPISESLSLLFQNLGNFVFSMLPQFTRLYECFPEKSSWCQNEQVCQGVKSSTTVRASAHVTQKRLLRLT